MWRLTREGNCELWEEVFGDHFYNRMTQAKALLQGAELATELNDTASAFWYRSQALQIQHEIEKHWKADRGLFLPTIGESGHAKGKISGLDASIILAVLHTGFDDRFLFETDDAKVLSNFHQLVSAFAALYPINHSGFEGLAIGRYPEDVYGGTHFERGNPWVLITAAFANFSYRNSSRAILANREEEARAWFAKAESFLSRIKRHENPDGSLSEQIDAETGYMISARDLTWSHVEVLQALRAREHASKAIMKFGVDRP